MLSLQWGKMSFLKRFWRVFLCVIVFSALTGKAAQASEDFDASAQATYRVDLSGTTSVNHTISLKNKRHNIYATQYSMTIGTTRINHVWAKDGIGNLEPSIQTSPNASTIKVDFRDKVVGLGQILHFTIGYDDEDIASKVGRVWEINVPRPEDLTEFTSYTITLIVPKEFKAPVQITPEPQSVAVRSDGTHYIFTDENLKSRGVTALFGDKQVFDFDLRYALDNQGPISKSLEIALPPDTAYQRMVYDRISPPPQTIRMDTDGNWLATYIVRANQELEIHATGKALLYLTPQSWSNTASTNDTSINLEEYLKPEPPWQVDDEAIRSLAQQLKSPENIYSYVVKTLSYNYDRVKIGARRLGAKQALEQPDQATCMEFTDLFIALARSAGIPAYTQNPTLRPLSLREDILHAWPEYYDQEKRSWIPVDPTWENTTQGIDYFSRFDLNHMVFVIHGNNAETPYPAGFYKIDNSEGKDIVITPDDEDPDLESKMLLTLKLPKNIIGGVQVSGLLKVTNVGGTALHQIPIRLESHGFDILTLPPQSLELLLPSTSTSIPIRLKNRDWLSNTAGELTITVGNEKSETQITFQPISGEIAKYTLALLVGAALAKASTRAGSLLLSLSRRRGAVRR